MCTCFDCVPIGRIEFLCKIMSWMSLLVHLYKYNILLFTLMMFLGYELSFVA